jgi:hypothetical protein
MELSGINNDLRLAGPKSPVPPNDHWGDVGNIPAASYYGDIQRVFWQAGANSIG